MKFGEQEYYNVGDIVRIKNKIYGTGVVESVHKQDGEFVFIVFRHMWSAKDLRPATDEDLRNLKYLEEREAKRKEEDRLYALETQRVNTQRKLDRERARAFVLENADVTAVQVLLADFSLLEAVYKLQQKIQNET